MAEHKICFACYLKCISFYHVRWLNLSLRSTIKRFKRDLCDVFQQRKRHFTTVCFFAPIVDAANHMTEKVQQRELEAQQVKLCSLEVEYESSQIIIFSCFDHT